MQTKFKPLMNPKTFLGGIAYIFMVSVCLISTGYCFSLFIKNLDKITPVTISLLFISLSLTAIAIWQGYGIFISKSFPQLLGVKQAKARERRFLTLAIVVFLILAGLAVTFWPHLECTAALTDMQGNKLCYENGWTFGWK